MTACATPRDLRAARRGKLREMAAQAPVNGLDFVEADVPRFIADPVVLRLVFVLPQAMGGAGNPATLTARNIALEEPVSGHRPRIAGTPAWNAATRTLSVTLEGGQRYDSAPYRLRLQDAPGVAAPPAGFDAVLADALVGFKVNCPQPLDCCGPEDGAAPVPPGPVIDYLVHDEASFRRLMLDRLAVLMPGFDGEQPADLTVTLVETLAHVADQLAYYQDAVAMEAYLGTARRRTSLRRHARLLDDAPREARAARVVARIAYAGPDDAELRADTVLLTQGEGPAALDPDELSAVLGQAPPPTAFRTLHPLRLRAAHDAIALHSFSGSRPILPQGATAATLVDQGLDLHAGDLLLFEQTASPRTGAAEDADPAARHLVRLTRVTRAADPVEAVALLEVAWAAADALPADFVFEAELPRPDGPPALLPCGIARGNLALAENGLSLPLAGPGGLVPLLDPPVAPQSGPWRPRVVLPRLDLGGLTHAVPFDTTPGPAVEALAPRGAAVADITLRDDTGAVWRPQPDLLGSNAFLNEFVVEPETADVTRLRFGDGVLGAAPAPGTALHPELRVGQGSAGNVGAGAITRIATRLRGVTGVTNPLPAVGGADAEPAEALKQRAPYGFRRQRRAVTEADYARVAEEAPGIDRAVARIRWTGAWSTAFVHVDGSGGGTVAADAARAAPVRALLEARRLAGQDIGLRDPRPVPLDIALAICIRPDSRWEWIMAALTEALSARRRRDGTPGFFHPDRFSFGQALYLSDLIAAAQAVDGVAEVTVERFRRLGRGDTAERDAGVIRPGMLEVLVCRSDPDRPGDGRVALSLRGVA